MPYVYVRAVVRAVLPLARNRPVFTHHTCVHVLPRYSSASQWAPIFGSLDYSYGASLPLWYADYDGTPSFDGWAQFGGWAGPTLKQFTDQGAKCGCNYDISWGPNLPE
jgi:hypothetical protein